MIFEDMSGRRRKLALAAVVLTAFLAGIPLAGYLLGLRLDPHFPGVTPPTSSVIAPAEPVRPHRLSSIVFAANDDPPGARSVDAHRAEIDVVVPDWFRLPGAGCAMEETVDDASKRWTKDARMKVVARVANLSGDAWAKNAAGAMLHDAEARSCVARSVAARSIALGAAGVNVDLESLAPGDADGLVAFLAELRAALGDRHISIDVTPDDPAFDLARIAPLVDGVVLMAYDEHEETSAPGPVASAAWFEGVVDRARAQMPAEKLVVGVGSYCYDWGSKVEPLGHGAALERAVAFGAKPEFTRETGGTRFDYVSAGTKHEVWCADAPAVRNQLAALRARGLTSWALWRAGSEDPSLWGNGAIEHVPAGADVTTTGQGDGWEMTAPPKTGLRDVTMDGDGFVRSATYRRLPAGRQLKRLGGKAKKEVVLTFDDGPDPVYTPRVLDALAAQNATATFFVLGEQAMSHPDLVRRIAREGHLVGNHSFHHPHIDTIGAEGLRTELRATERVLEGELGRYTTFFRAPYTAAFDANEPGLMASHLPAFEAGYRVVGGDVDPADWSQPGASAIADAILAQVAGGGRIVVLHDAGGDRTQTVEAIGLALPRLRAEGYEIVSLEKHFGLERNVVAPSVDPQDRAIAHGARAATFVKSHAPSLLGVLFSACTGLAAFRCIMLVGLALKRRRKVEPTGARDPLVSVLVPAYNEEKVLRRTVESLLASDYTNLEILVIDDGSTDDTSKVARTLAQEDGRVRSLRKFNGGKAAASNYGLAHAQGEIVVCVDADTLIGREAVRLLVRRFDDEAVSAVCGNVEVGNVRSLLTAFQAIEYVTSQNLDRRALAAVNAVNVVPGALGAWRKEVLVNAGGYAHDTLVEDADLTLTVLQQGGRIDYEPKAIARTEAPETITALWKQRFRWTFGTYQCLAKHRGTLGKGTVGTIALPNMILFQVLFPLLSPIGDLVMVVALIQGNWAAVASGYLGFLALDFLSSVIAFKLDDKPMKWLPLLLIQRFTYRQLMYLICLRAFVAALAGRRHGWKKLDRTGTATLASIFPPPPPSVEEEEEPAPASLAA